MNVRTPWKAPTVIKVGHMSHLKVVRLTCLWAGRVAHSDNCWWSFMVLLDWSCWDLSNDTCNVVIRDFMCHHSFFVSFTFTDYKEERGREKKNKQRKKNPKAHWWWNQWCHKKISTKRFQQHLERSITMSRLGHISRLKATEPLPPLGSSRDPI